MIYHLTSKEAERFARRAFRFLTVRSRDLFIPLFSFHASFFLLYRAFISA